ncbi:MAG: copper resistance protein CopD [Salinigranum sp.]
MALLETVVAVTHLVVGALWVGSVTFVAVTVLPAARDGTLNAGPTESMLGSLVTGSRASSVLMLLTGGYLAGVRYGGGSMTGTTDGWLVIAMVVLWLAFTALIEIGASRARDGLGQGKVRAPAGRALTAFRIAALVGFLLLVDAGVLLG